MLSLVPIKIHHETYLNQFKNQQKFRIKGNHVKVKNV